MDEGDVARLRGMEVDVQFGQMVAGNLPAVLVGALKLWPAISRWDPANSGLEYLKELTVTLWPPSEAPYLYPRQIHGEASNHSGVDIVAPNYDMHPLFRKALQNAKVVTLQSGDALFIPEGWYHQVDNVGVTIAVNFWWPSKITLSIGSQMDGYILRRVVSSLVDREKKRMLKDGIESFTDRREESLLTERTRHISREVNLSDNQGERHSKVEDMKDLTAEEAIHLKTLVTSALGETKISPPAKCKLVKNNGRSYQIKDDNVQVQSTYQRRVLFQEDLVYGVFATLGALSLQRVLLVMATQFPVSLRVLVMDVLSPAATELLTMKFEELEGSLENSLQGEFYEKFYSVFESSEMVMAILLEKKEAFAAQALRTVMSEFLGLCCCPAHA